MRLIDPTKEKFEFKKSSSQFNITKENFNKGLWLLFVRNAANRVYCSIYENKYIPNKSSL